MAALNSSLGTMVMFGLSSFDGSQHRSESLEAGRWGVGEADGPGDTRAGEAGALSGALERGERQGRLLEERPTRGGELDVAAVTHEQVGPKRPLELVDLVAQRRLGDVEARCGSAEVELLRDGQEVAQQARLEVDAAIGGLEALADELAHSHPGAAASLREGLAETVTLQRLGVHPQLWKSLSSTNPIESMIGICRATSRNVKRWQNGDMCLRWTAAGMLEAERQFRKIIGYKHLAALALAVEADVAAGRATTSRSTTSPTDPPTTAEPAATLAAAH
jgi:hypothetical protein